jgi:hypothetical protein
MPPAIPPTIAPVLLLLWPELAPADGVMRTVDWIVVVTIWPLAPVETITDVITEVDVLVGVRLDVSSFPVFPFATDVIVVPARWVVVGFAAGWVVGVFWGGVVDC